MSAKLLTIVVPTYNTQELLPRCLDSLILEDSLINKLEVFIVIDGSPDDSAMVAKSYASRFPEVFFVVEKENGGHGSTINKGLELASGKYFKVLDSDDWFDKKEFRLFLKGLDELDVDIVLSDYVKEYLFEERQEQLTLPIKKELEFSIDSFRLEEHSDLIFAMARTYFKTELLRASQVYLLEKTFYVDTILAFTPIYEAKSFVYLGYDVYRYFIGRDDQSVSSAAMLRNRSHLERVIKLLWTEYLAKGAVISENRKMYFVSFLQSLITRRYLVLNKLEYFEARKELKEWNLFYNGMKSHLQGNRVISLYNILPYSLWRWLVNNYL